MPARNFRENRRAVHRFSGRTADLLFASGTGHRYFTGHPVRWLNNRAPILQNITGFRFPAVSLPFSLSHEHSPS
jgi:hypothetical protein